MKSSRKRVEFLQRGERIVEPSGEVLTVVRVYDTAGGWFVYEIKRRSGQVQRISRLPWEEVEVAANDDVTL